MTNPRNWLTADEAAALIPGMTVDRLKTLGDDGPRVWVLSDGQRLYDELLLRRWLESTVDFQWVHGCWGAHRAGPSPERSHTYQDAQLDLLRRRTYIGPAALHRLIPDLPEWVAKELRARGTGPRFLRPTPKTIVYVAEEALWWAEQVPSPHPRHEGGVTRAGVDRPLHTPPIAR